MTVREMLGRMDARELTEWQAFYSVEPFGDVQDDYRMGLLASMYAAVHKRKGAADAKPSDWFGSLKVEPRPQTKRDKIGLAHRIAQAFGFKLKK